MFEIKTYAAMTAFVPDWRDNRVRWKSGKAFMWVDLEPCNSAELEEFKSANENVGAHMLDVLLVKSRCKHVHNFRISSNDQSVMIPKDGIALSNGVRDQMFELDYKKLISSICLGIIDHSELSSGELDSSASSQGSPPPATETP